MLCCLDIYVEGVRKLGYLRELPITLALYCVFSVMVLATILESVCDVIVSRYSISGFLDPRFDLLIHVDSVCSFL